MNVNDVIEIYKRSCDLIIAYLDLDGTEKKQISTDEDRENIDKGIKGLETVLEYDKQNWAALWMLGKIKQVLSLNEESYECFLKAHSIQPTNEDISRELTLQCLRTNRYSQAEYYANLAAEFDLNDYTLWVNFAVAKLFNNKLGEAKIWIKKALEKLPDDEPAKAIDLIISEIEAGNMKMPKSFLELEKNV